jgi:hypothetical protein
MQLDASGLTLGKLHGIYCYSCSSEEKDRMQKYISFHNEQAHCQVLSLFREGIRNVELRVSSVRIHYKK